MDIDQLLASHGGIASLAELAAAHISPHHVRRAVDDGRATRIRQGWIAAPGAPTAAIRAVRVGGFLTCVSALRMHGVWCPEDDRLHVRVDRHANHLASPDDRRQPLGSRLTSKVVLHRSRLTDQRCRDLPIDTVECALLHAVTCQTRDNAVVLFDSALNLGLVSMQRLETLAATLTDQHRNILKLTDAASQSGLESKARLRLHALGIPYRTQVSVDRVGRVDLLVGDRLVLEVDGREWHTNPVAFAEDRRRDLVLGERGYHVLRLSYAQVMFEWPRAEALVRALVGRHEHRWSTRHRHAGLVPALVPVKAITLAGLTDDGFGVKGGAAAAHSSALSGSASSGAAVWARADQSAMTGAGRRWR